jgi:hypothetical protein
MTADTGASDTYTSNTINLKNEKIDPHPHNIRTAAGTINYEIK